nr:energy-coupling factor transporter ATPase [Salipaludibacillus keqinensis]
MKGTPFEKNALTKVDLSLSSGQFTSIIGHTGSGKSTLVQHLNGLLKPTEGTITIGDWIIRPETKQKNLYSLREHVGMVFQFPEHQLFNETILQDVAYGPINFGKTKQEAEDIAKECLHKVGIPETLYDQSPFDISGGQMRRVAIAGVLALDPTLLILDEPTAGLDPHGQETIMHLFYEWFQETDERSIVLVTHQMEDAARYSDQILVMDRGQVVDQGSPEHIFSKGTELRKLGLSVPQSVQLLQAVRSECGGDMEIDAFTLEETVNRLLVYLKKRGVNDHV